MRIDIFRNYKFIVFSRNFYKLIEKDTGNIRHYEDKVQNLAVNPNQLQVDQKSKKCSK